MMNVIRFDDLNAFYARVEPYLLPREAEHNLTFGLLSNIRNDPSRFPEPVFALVEHNGAIQMVALRTNVERALILSLAQSPDAIPALAESLHADGINLTSANGPADEARAFVESWSRLSGQRYSVNTPMRTFRLEKVNPVTGVPGHLRRATTATAICWCAGCWNLSTRRSRIRNTGGMTRRLRSITACARMSAVFTCGTTTARSLMLATAVRRRTASVSVRSTRRRSCAGAATPAAASPG
ncbi:MAG: hypothetical protein U0703_13715 [Anaerolineae bacterium]